MGFQDKSEVAFITGQMGNIILFFYFLFNYVVLLRVSYSK